MSPSAINGARLRASLMQMATIGAAPNGIVCRPALTDLDRQARDLFVRWCQEAGCSVTVDRIGHIVARRSGRNDSLASVGTGGRLDTPPSGGPVDGAYGVLAGLEVIRTLNDHGIETERPVEAVVWSNRDPHVAPARWDPGVYEGVWNSAQGADLEHPGASTGSGERTDVGDAEPEWTDAAANALFQAMLASANELPDVFTSTETVAVG